MFLAGGWRFHNSRAFLSLKNGFELARGPKWKAVFACFHSWSIHRFVAHVKVQQEEEEKRRQVLPMLLCEHMTSRAISGPWLLGWDFGWREGKLVVKKEEEGRRRRRRGEKIRLNVCCQQQQEFSLNLIFNQTPAGAQLCTENISIHTWELWRRHRE